MNCVYLFSKRENKHLNLLLKRSVGLVTSDGWYGFTACNVVLTTEALTLSLHHPPSPSGD